MITVHYIGRRSNNMIQYAFGRILAMESGMGMTAININRDLEETYGINVPYGSNYFEGQSDFPNAYNVYGDTIEGEPIQIDDSLITGKLKSLIHLSTRYIVEKKRPIVLHGFFQFGGIYGRYINDMMRWFWTPQWGTLSNEPDIKNDWCFHLRHEDYVNEIRLPIEYYLNVIRKNNIKSFDFIGKDIDQEYMRELINAGGTYYSQGSSIRDWRFLKAHRNFACANSSFSGVAAWLSPQADKIIIPVPEEGYWSRGSDQQFFIKDSNMEEMEA